jgi:hypothetical protein
MLIVFFLAAAIAAGQSPESLAIESGSATFEAGTNVPGIEVKGTSSVLTGRASVLRGDGPAD